MKYRKLILILALAANFSLINAQQTVFAMIGDFGSATTDATDVADLVKSWDPQFVVTNGDNRYYFNTYDETVGYNYCEFLADADSSVHCDGNGDTINAFFPSTGNHDHTDGGGIEEYLSYFNIPGTGIQSSGTSGSELYYDFIMGPVHFFMVDSYGAINNGTMSTQQTWLQNQMEASGARWKIVVFHHPPYSSSANHGSTVEMRWPFAEWGADAVTSGHTHLYERLSYDSITYIVNGLAGGYSRYEFSDLLPGSIVHYNDQWGAQRFVVDDTSMTFSFINIDGVLIDEHTIIKPRVNTPPVFDSDTIAITDATEDSTYLDSIGDYASDPDVDSLHYSIISGPGWLSMTPEGDLSGTPLNDDVGLNSWLVEVEDGELGADSATLQITVINTNDNPAFISDTITITNATEDSTYLDSIGDYASDPDVDSLLYSIISGPSWLSMTPEGDLSGTPLNDDVGLNSWLVEVEDGELGTDSAALQITVINTNDNPAFTGDTITITDATEDSTYLDSIGDYASDPDGDSLHFSIISGPGWLTMASNGDLSGTPLNDDLGLNSWLVEVEDGELGADSATLQITVLSTSQDTTVGSGFFEYAAGEDNSGSIILVYPNPASDRMIVKISAWEGLKDLRLYNISGKMVYMESDIAEHTEIDVSSFAEGVYFLKIYDEKFSRLKEILVQ